MSFKVFLQSSLVLVCIVTCSMLVFAEEKVDQPGKGETAKRGFSPSQPRASESTQNVAGTIDAVVVQGINTSGLPQERTFGTILRSCSILLAFVGMFVSTIVFAIGLIRLAFAANSAMKQPKRLALVTAIVLLVLVLPVISFNLCVKYTGEPLPDLLGYLLVGVLFGGPVLGTLIAIVMAPPGVRRLFVIAITVLLVSLGTSVGLGWCADTIRVHEVSSGEIDKYTKELAVHPEKAQLYALRGEVFGRLGQHQKAIDDFTKAIQLEATPGQACRFYEKRAIAYAALGKRDLADMDRRNAADRDPSKIAELADQCLTGREFRKAIQYIDKAIVLDPERAWFERMRGYAYGELGQYEKALSAYTRAIKIEPGDSWTYSSRGYVYDKLQQFEKAVDDYTKAIDKEYDLHKKADPYYCRGDAYSSLGQYKKAIDDYSKAIELSSKSASYYSARGLSFEKLGANSKAIEDFNQAIELDPSDAQLFAALARVHTKMGRCDLANSDLQVVKNMMNPEFLFQQGEKSLESKKYDVAVGQFSKAIELDPKLAVAYSSRGIAYANLGQGGDALVDCSKAIELSPNDVRGFLRRAEVYEWLEQYQKEIEDCSLAIKLDPKCASAYGNRGFAYSKLNERQKQIEDLSKAIELSPNDALYYRNRGTAYHKTNQFYKAIEDDTKAIELEPKNALLYNNRAAVYFAMEKYQETINDCTKAIELDPNFVLAYYNRKRAYRQLGMNELADKDEKKEKDLPKQGHPAANWW